MAREFIGRAAIVTGAGKGIGQATAVAFSKLGARRWKSSAASTSPSLTPVSHRRQAASYVTGTVIPVDGEMTL